MSEKYKTDNEEQKQRLQTRNTLSAAAQKKTLQLSAYGGAVTVFERRGGREKVAGPCQLVRGPMTFS